MTEERKTEFWWASVAGADCEPVEVTMLDGERVAYTCGCGDPFYLDRPDCPVVLVGVGYPRRAMERPLSPMQQKLADEAWDRERVGVSHSWRGPR